MIASIQSANHGYEIVHSLEKFVGVLLNLLTNDSQPIVPKVDSLLQVRNELFVLEHADILELAFVPKHATSLLFYIKSMLVFDQALSLLEIVLARLESLKELLTKLLLVSSVLGPHA